MASLVGDALSRFAAGTMNLASSISSSPSTTRSKQQQTSVIATAVLAAVPLALVIRRILKKKPKLPYPPGPEGVFFFGNTLDFPNPDTEFLDDKLLEWSLEYGLVFTLHAPIIGRMIICADPDLVHHINVSRNYPKSFTYRILTPVLGAKGMVIAQGEEWAKMRRAFNPGFAPSFLKGMASTMNEKMERFLRCIDKDISDGVETNMLARAQTFTSDVIVSIAFGEDWGGEKQHAARAWNTEICNNLNGVLFDPMKMLFGFKTKRKIRHYEKLLDEEMRKRLAALNPEASVRMANRLIEAHERNYWQPDAATLEALQAGADELEDAMEGVGVAAE